MMAKPWNEHRSIITRLYIHDGRKLEDVRTIMKNKYGFEASIRSYRQHFDQWNVGKYNCKKRQRRRQAMARPVLPSPPPTPYVGVVTPMMSIRYQEQHHGGGLHVGNVRFPSPESLSSCSTRSSISSIHSPPEQRLLPDISSLSPQHRLVQMHHSRFPPYYPGNASTTVVRNKSLDAMGPPPSAAAFEEDMQVALRNPSMSEGMLPYVKPPMSPPLLAERHRGTEQSSSPGAVVGLDNTNVDSKANVKYVPRSTYPEPSNWTAVRRSTASTPLQMDECYRLYNTTSRGAAESFPGASTPRSMDIRTVVSSPNSLSRLPEGRHTAQPERKFLPEHMASSHMSYDQGLVSA